MIPRSDTCLVSIWSSLRLMDGTYDGIPINMDGWKASLRLDFDDITGEGYSIPIMNDTGEFEMVTPVPFSKEQGKQLLDFIIEHHGSPFVIHCDAGVSRSVAVASFMEMVYDYTPTYHQTGTDQYRNILVFNTLRRVWLASTEGFEDGEEEGS